MPKTHTLKLRAHHTLAHAKSDARVCVWWSRQRNLHNASTFGSMYWCAKASLFPYSPCVSACVCAYWFHGKYWRKMCDSQFPLNEQTQNIFHSICIKTKSTEKFTRQQLRATNTTHLYSANDFLCMEQHWLREWTISKNQNRSVCYVLSISSQTTEKRFWGVVCLCSICEWIRRSYGIMLSSSKSYTTTTPPPIQSSLEYARRSLCLSLSLSLVRFMFLSAIHSVSVARVCSRRVLCLWHTESNHINEITLFVSILLCTHPF